MTDAQKALEDCFFSSQHFTDKNKAWEFVKNYEHEIRRALAMLAAVEAGTHKIVPVEPTEEMLDECRDGNGVECKWPIKTIYKTLLQAAPDFAVKQEEKQGNE